MNWHNNVDKLVLTCDFIYLTIVHAKSGRAFFLSNQNNRAHPAVLTWLDDASIQHFLDLSFFPHLVCDVAWVGGVWDGALQCQWSA